MRVIELTRDAEKRRIKETRTYQPTKWEYYSGSSLVTAARTAKDMGWKEKKVQVRYVEDDEGHTTYYVEPYEKGCGCKGILKYKDFFD